MAFSVKAMAWQDADQEQMCTYFCPISSILKFHIIEQAEALTELWRFNYSAHFIALSY